jgi:DNA replication protein DnaC
MEPIGETLKKITNATSKANMVTSENTGKQKKSTSDTVCLICGGLGYVRRNLPIDDPNFGQLEICICQKESAQRDTLARLYRTSNLESFKELTFDNFKTKGHGSGKAVNKTLEVAFNTAQNYAHHLNGWLLLMGGYGTGKTHLAAAIAHEVVSLGIETLFLTVPDLLDWLRNSYGSNETSYESRFDEIRNIRFLVLDDLGTQNATPWAREKLFQIMNHRYTQRLPTLITTNLPLSQIDDRISSRLQDKQLVIAIQIDAPDYRNPLAEGDESPISSLAHVSDHRTFDKFSTREGEKLSSDAQKSIEQAFYAAQHFADKPDGWLVLMGNYGVGKTHLAAAIGHYQAGLGGEPIFAVVPDLLDHLRATFSPTSTVSYDNIFTQVKNAKLLILDDLGTQNATPWAREKLYQILNFRYETRQPTVITTSSSFEELDPRIRSRMMDERVCKVYVIVSPPYKTQADKRKKSVN